MRIAIRLVQGLIFLLLVALLAGAWYLLPGERLREPALTGVSEDSSLRAGGMRRSYVLYVPQKLAPNPALLVVLHASQSNGEGMRRDSGYGFDALADRYGFLVLYPDGFEGHWNDCRKAASYSARTEHIDDVAFLSRLIRRVQRERQVDPQQVFVAGYSNGGQMALRMAAEGKLPLAGIALVAATPPTPDNDDCRPLDKPLATLLMNGTRDPINPYAGGRVRLFGFGDRGDVMGSEDAAAAQAKRNGIDAAVEPEQLTRPGPIWSERLVWQAAGTPPVELVSVHGGGHLLSQPGYRPPRLLGAGDPELDGPAEIWRFFSQSLPPAAQTSTTQ